MARKPARLDHAALAGSLGPLTREDLESVAWRRLEELLARRIAELRVANDRIRPPTQEYRTHILRGRIAEIKALLALHESVAPGLRPGPEQAPDTFDDDE